MRYLRLKYLLSCLTICLLALFLAPLARAQEIDVSTPFVPTEYDELIPTFHSEITINPDTSISITETIDYTTTLEKHGIYRYIPVRYTRNGFNYTAKVKKIKVTELDGSPINFERSYDSGNVVLKIGDADVTFTGDKTYVISYVVENAVQQVIDRETNAEVPELFWDITGEGWQIRIQDSTATVNSPAADIIMTDCFSGLVGSDDDICQLVEKNPESVRFAYDQPIDYGYNMTVVVKIDPEGGIVFPTPTQKFLKSLNDNKMLGLILLPGIIMFSWWWRKGRDKAYESWNVFNNDASQPQRTLSFWHWRPIPMVYEPFKDLTPGEAGAMLDDKVDNQDVIAEIIDLAHKKVLKIERLDKGKKFWEKNDYQFTKLMADPPRLPKQQRYLFDRIFATGDTVKLSDLKGSFYSYMEKTRSMIFDSLTSKGYFESNPQTVRGLAWGACIFLLVLAGVFGINMLEQGMYWVLPLFAVSALVSMLAAYFMPAKTAPGTNYSLQVHGLRQSIERGSWSEKIKEKHLFFEEVLPFAVALGVVDQLSRDMAELNVKPPSYFDSSTARGWNTASFVNSFSSQAQSSLSYNPSSSSYGSSSGGSSGGGGGGGGGGSW